MHKFILKNFERIIGLVQFFQIIVVFGVITLLLYWVQNLLNTKWAWFSVFVPINQIFVDLGAQFMDGSLQLLDTIFEFKYFVAFIFYVLLYCACNLLIFFINQVKNTYESARIIVKRNQEKQFNKNLNKELVKEQEAIQKYRVYISCEKKEGRNANLIEFDINKQEAELNKFLIQQTGVSPRVYENGFLYCFSKFDDIDSVLEVFFRVLKSKAPVNYVICVQALSRDVNLEEQLKNLIRSHLINKIVMMSDVAWRYGYNTVKKYEVSSLGVFQLDGESFDINSFEEKNQD